MLWATRPEGGRGPWASGSWCPWPVPKLCVAMGCAGVGDRRVPRQSGLSGQLWMPELQAARHRIPKGMQENQGGVALGQPLCLSLPHSPSQ